MLNKLLLTGLAKFGWLAVASFFCTIANAQTTWNLNAGWNLLANNSIGPIQVATDIVNDPTKVNTVWTWDHVASSWAFYSPTMSNSALAAYAHNMGYTVLTSIAPNQGYWVNASNKFSATTRWNKGSLPLSLASLQQGWNLLGSSDNKLPSEFVHGLFANVYAPDKVISSVWAWNAPASNWMFYAPALDLSGGLSTYITAHSFIPFTTPISPGVGYWVNVTGPNPSDYFTEPTDINLIAYPNSYQTGTVNASDITLAPCNLNASQISYPRSWLGNYPLPTVTGAPLKTTIGRGMSLKDIMLPDNPAFVLSGAPTVPAGCQGDLKAEFNKTIARLKALGVDYVSVPQWEWASKNPDGSWFIFSPENTFGSLSDDYVTYLVKAAHAAGMKVIMRNQIQGMVDSPTSSAYVPDATFANFQKWFVAYRTFMNERSKFFQSIGIDVWELGCQSCMYGDAGSGTTETINLFSQQYQSILANVKTNYSGQMLIAYPPAWMTNNPDFIKSIDVIQTGVYIPTLSADQSANLSVNSLKAIILNQGFLYSMSSLDQFGKTILLTIGGVQSRENALTQPGYMEETMCTGSIGVVFGTTGCIQQETQVDFSVQAIALEAMLELAGQLTLNSNSVVLTGDYWETNSLWPQTAFPNLAGSPRNKPAEGILKKWFARSN